VHIAVSLAGSGPFWGVLTAALFLGEPLTVHAVGAAAAVVVGAAFLVSPRGAATGDRRPLALLAALGTAVLWGFTTAVPAKYCMSAGMTPITYQLVMVLSAGSLWAAVALRAGLRADRRFTVRGVGVAAASSFTGFFLGWILWLTALERAPASLVSPLNGSTTLFAFLLGALSFRERPTWRAVVGGALVIVGVILVSTAPG
jgi:drug/metabolite transporter (DMT)-like permease